MRIRILTIWLACIAVVSCAEFEAKPDTPLESMDPEARALALSPEIEAYFAAPPPTQSSGAIVSLDPDNLIRQGRIQQAIWQLSEQGDHMRAISEMKKLEQILRSDPISIKELGTGLSDTYILTFSNLHEAIFKTQNGDLLCKTCISSRERAVYEIDLLLGFDLTPMTIMRIVKLSDGKVEYGSAMYFINNARKGGAKPDKLRLFDAIIGNSDRHDGNWLISPTGRSVAIDHNRAFRFDTQEYRRTNWDAEVKAVDMPCNPGEAFARYAILPDEVFEGLLDRTIKAVDVDRFLAYRPKVLELLNKQCALWRNVKSQSP